MMLAVFALVFGQVAAMPVAVSVAVSWDEATHYASYPMQTEAGQAEPAVPCHHHANAQGLFCCCAADCPMLAVALSAGVPAVHPMTRHKLAYRQDAAHPPPGTDAAPLLPPPRFLT